MEMGNKILLVYLSIHSRINKLGFAVEGSKAAGVTARLTRGRVMLIRTIPVENGVN